MSYSPDYKDQRRDARVNTELSVLIRVGTQLTLQGHLKDISLKSAFIRIKNNVFLQTGDPVGFTVQCSPKADEDLIEGTAAVSRIVPGEGMAIYFTKMDEASSTRLRKLLV